MVNFILLARLASTDSVAALVLLLVVALDHAATALNMVYLVEAKAAPAAPLDVLLRDPSRWAPSLPEGAGKVNPLTAGVTLIVQDISFVDGDAGRLWQSTLLGGEAGQLRQRL